VLRILIVEDDSQLAATLKYLVEDNPRYRVVATADDADSALAAAAIHDPDLVLLDLHLAHGSTGEMIRHDAGRARKPEIRRWAAPHRSLY